MARAPSTAGQLGSSDCRPRATAFGLVWLRRSKEGPGPASCSTWRPRLGRAALTGGCPSWVRGRFVLRGLCPPAPRPPCRPLHPRPWGLVSREDVRVRPSRCRCRGARHVPLPQGVGPGTSRQLGTNARRPGACPWACPQGSAAGAAPTQAGPAPSGRTGSGSPAPSPVCPHVIHNLPGSLDPETHALQSRGQRTACTERGTGSPHPQGPLEGAGLLAVHLVPADLKRARVGRGSAMQHRGWATQLQPRVLHGSWLPRCSRWGPHRAPFPGLAQTLRGRGDPRGSGHGPAWRLPTGLQVVTPGPLGPRATARSPCWLP